MGKLVAGAQPGDVSVFYCEHPILHAFFEHMSHLLEQDNGHGVQIETDDKDEEDGYDEGTSPRLLDLKEF